MDATHDVVGRESQSAPGEVFETAERLHEEIRVTGQALHDHFEELRRNLTHRVESLSNPFGLRESVEARPLVACGAAFIAGVVFSGVRNRPAPAALAQQVWGILSSALAGQVTARIFRS